MLLIAIVSAESLTFCGCSSSTEKKVDEAGEAIQGDIQKEKEDIATELRALRDGINDRVDKITLALETAKSGSIQQLEETKSDLLVQRDKVENALDEIDKTADDTWDDIQSRTQETANEVKVDFQRLAARVDSVLVK